ncbi:MAG: TonB family protein [Bacteroidales bacterium]|nr:TonB family protein [Bacteroidales bacterium]
MSFKIVIYIMTKNNDKYKGIIGTVLFHVAIILLLLFLGFSTPLPLPGEEGVEVSLGANNEGIGYIQPKKPASVKKTTPPPKQADDAEDIVTQDIEPAPSIEKSEGEKTEEKTVEEVEEKEIVKEEPKVNPAALYKGKSEEVSEESSEGITGKEGDQGKPTGTKDSKNYLGQGGFGNGLSYSLKGRSPKYLPKPKTNFKENGTVVVQITVDKYGKVIKAIAIDKGSNTTNASLRRLAEEAAKKAIFNANPDAPEVQKGTITYHFIVKN